MSGTVKEIPFDVMFEKIVLEWTEDNQVILDWKEEQGKRDIEDYLMMTSMDEMEELYVKAGLNDKRHK